MLPLFLLESSFILEQSRIKFCDKINKEITGDLQINSKKSTIIQLKSKIKLSPLILTKT